LTKTISAYYSSAVEDFLHCLCYSMFLWANQWRKTIQLLVVTYLVVTQIRECLWRQQNLCKYGGGSQLHALSTDLHGVRFINS